MHSNNVSPTRDGVSPVGRSFPRERCRNPGGFTILELLVSMGVISVLAALVLPAVSSAREAARKVECVNHLKQIGVALHSYHDQHGALPPGLQWESQHQSAYGWGVPLLSFLDQSPVYRQTHRDRLLNDPANAQSRQAALPVFLCPSDISEPQFTLYEEDEVHGVGAALLELPTANYVGVFGTFEADEPDCQVPGDGTFIESRSIRFEHIQRGLSNTLFVGERTMAQVPSTWLGVDARGADAACRLVGNAAISPNCRECDECEFTSRHSGGANFLWGDGRVSLVSESIDSLEYQNLARRANR